MARKTRLKIMTPERTFFDDDVDMFIMRTQTGDVGILAGHIPLTTTLSYGTIIIYMDEKEYKASLMGGFAEALPDKITIVSEAAEWPHEIDTKRAERAKERAEKRMAESATGLDVKRAEAALRKSAVRLEVSSYKLNETYKPRKMEQV